MPRGSSNGGWEEAGGKKKKKTAGGNGAAPAGRGKPMSEGGAPMKMRAVQDSDFARAEKLIAKKKASAAKQKQHEGDLATAKKEQEAARQQSRKEKAVQKLLGKAGGKGGGKKGGGKKKGRGPAAMSIADALDRFDLGSIEEQVALARAKYPEADKAVFESYKALAGMLATAFAPCAEEEYLSQTDANAAGLLEPSGAPLNKVEQGLQKQLLALLSSFPNGFLHHMFFFALKEIVFETTNSVGLLLLIQLLIRLETDSNGKLAIVVPSLQLLDARFFKGKDVQLLPKQLLRIAQTYAHTVKLPSSYIRFWIMFNLRVVQFPVKWDGSKKPQPVTVPAILNPALKDCQTEAFKYLRTIFDDKLSASGLLQRVFPDSLSASPQRYPMSPADVFWLHKLSEEFSGPVPPGTELPPGLRDEINRCLPHFQAACEAFKVGFFVRMFHYYTSSPPSLKALMQRWAIKEPKCLQHVTPSIGPEKDPHGAPQKKGFYLYPIQSTYFLLDIAQVSLAVPGAVARHSSAVSKAAQKSAFQAKVLASAKECAEVAATLKEAEEAKKKKKKEKVIEMLDHLADQLAKIQLAMTSAGKSNPLLWFMLVLSFGVFVSLFTHLICRLELYPEQTTVPCDSIEGSWVFDRVEAFYKWVEPWATKVEPHMLEYVAIAGNATAPAISAISDGYDAASATIAPHLAAAWATCAPVMAPATAAVADTFWAAEEATREARASVWTTLVAWVGMAWAWLSTAVWPAVSEALAAVWAAISTFWIETAQPMLGPAVESARAVTTDAIENGYAKVIELIG